MKEFDKNLKSNSTIQEIGEDKIINEYNNKFKVIPSNVAKYFSEKILN